jgi:uncharacterized protein (TIGR02186 family)
MRRAALASAVLALFTLGGHGDAQEPLLADLSSHLIAVTTGFTGAELLLFGAIEQAGDIALVVRGPPTPMTVRRKERVVGVWVNEASVRFKDVPSFYGIAATEGFVERAPPALLRSMQFGIDNLRLIAEDRRPAEAGPFRAALVRRMRQDGLFGTGIEPVAVLGDRLFRASVWFPSNVPTGVYSVEVYFVVDGDIASAQTTPLSVSRLGIGAEIFDFAHRQAIIYGLVAILMAGSAGWLAGFIFRKG